MLLLVLCAVRLLLCFLLSLHLLSIFVPCFASCFIYLLFVSFGRRFEVTTSMKASDVNIAVRWWLIRHIRSPFLSPCLMPLLSTSPAWVGSSRRVQSNTSPQRAQECIKLDHISTLQCQIDTKKHGCMFWLFSAGFLLFLNKHSGTPQKKATTKNKTWSLTAKIYSLGKFWMIHQPEIRWCSSVCLANHSSTKI